MQKSLFLDNRFISSFSQFLHTLFSPRNTKTQNNENNYLKLSQFNYEYSRKYH